MRCSSRIDEIHSIFISWSLLPKLNYYTHGRFLHTYQLFTFLISKNLEIPFDLYILGNEKNFDFNTLDFLQKEKVRLTCIIH